MLDSTKEVQGVGVYAEFRKPGATMQIIVTPDGYASNGKEVTANLFRRVVTPSTPKKQWRNSHLSSAPVAELEGAQIEEGKKSSFVASRIGHYTELFDALNSGGWQIVKEPFCIEVSKKDLEDIQTGKTPNKMLYRITQTRNTLAFPAELIA